MNKDAGVELSKAMKGPTSIIEVRKSGHHLYIDNYK